MKFLQLIYTSCKRGASPGAGFQTFAMSEGISLEEKQEIERCGLYVAPTDLPTQPTEAEIADKFPVAFRFFRLKSGRYAICRAQYIGRDYSGRYGNYFSHTLVVDSGTFPGYPIQWYNSSLFRSALNPEEVNLQTTPPPLPALDMAAMEAGRTLQLEDVTAFIEEQGMDTLKQMLAAVINHDQAHRRLVLCDHHQRTALWIAAIQMAFPEKLANQLTFSTYTHDPAAMDIMISGVPRTGSRFAFSETQRNYEYYIFELTPPPDAGNTSVIDLEYEYIKNVEIGYTFSPENLVKYHQFISGFQPAGINRELDHIDTLYHMSETGIEGISGDRVLEALEYANREASPQILGKLADGMGQVVTGLSRHADFKTADTVSKFLFKVARQSGEPKHLKAAYDFFFQTLDYLIQSRSQPDLQAVTALYDSIMVENKMHMREFSAKALDPKRIEQLEATLSQAPHPGRIEIYLLLLLNTVFAIDYSWDSISLERKGFQPYTAFSMAHIAGEPGRLRRILEAAAQDKDFLAQLVLFCLRRRLVREQEQQSFMDSLIATLKNKPSEIPAYVRMKLVDEGQQDFVYEEYLTLLKGSQKRLEFFTRYAESVFLKIPRFLKSHFSRAVKDYLDYLPGQDMFPACSSLIMHGGVLEDDGVLERVVLGVEKGLPLSEPKEKELQIIYTCGTLKNERKITTSPDITRLILLAIEVMKVYASQGRSPLKLKDLLKGGSQQVYNLQNLDFTRIKNYFSWVFPFMLWMVETAQDHAMVFIWFDKSKLDKSWVSDYPKELKHIIREGKGRGLTILREFLVFYLKQLHKEPAYTASREIMREKLVKILCKLPHAQFQVLRDSIMRSTATDKSTGRREWTTLLEGVEEKNRKLGFNIFKRLFTKKNVAAMNGKNDKRTKKPGLQKI